MPVVAMNGSQYETILISAFLRLGVGESAFLDGHVVADLRQLNRRALVLGVYRGPAVKLQPARSRRAAEEHQDDRTILRRIARADGDDPRVGARNDLGTALEVGRAGQQH